MEDTDDEEILLFTMDICAGMMHLNKNRGVKRRQKSLGQGVVSAKREKRCLQHDHARTQTSRY